MVFKNLTDCSKFIMDLYKRLTFLEQKFEGALGCLKDRRKEIYWRKEINTKEMLNVLKETIIKIVNEDKATLTGFKNQWYCPSYRNPLLQTITDVGVTIPYTSLKDSTGTFLPNNMLSAFAIVIHETDRLVNVTYYNNKIKLVASTLGPGSGKVSLLVTHIY